MVTKIIDLLSTNQVGFFSHLVTMRSFSLEITSTWLDYCALRMQVSAFSLYLNVVALLRKNGGFMIKKRTT